jgi:O-antigen/teichoic acid export membrane protein
VSTLGRVVKNTVALLAADVFSKVINFVFIAILIRQLTPAEYGGYTTVISLILFLGPLTDLGISQVLIREVAANRPKAGVLLSNALLITAGLSVVSAGVLFAISAYANYPADLRPLIRIAALAVFGNAITQTAGSVFRGLERMEIQAALNSGLLLAASVTGIILSLSGHGLETQIYAYTLISLIGASLTVTLIRRRFVPFTWRIDLGIGKMLFLMALPIAVLIAYRVLLRWSDILILGQTRSLEEVAVYGAAQKTIDLVAIISASATAALFPVLASAWKKSVEGTKRLFLQAMRFFSAFGMAAAIGLTVLAEPVTVTLYGEVYRPAALAIQVLAWAFFFTVISGPMGTMLLASDRYLKKIIAPMGSIVVGNIVLNVLLTPAWGYMGSAVIFLGTAIATFSVRQWAVHFFFEQPPRLAALLAKPLGAGLAMGAALYLLRSSHIAISIPVGAAVFVAVLGLLGEFREEPYRGLITLVTSRFARGA